MIRSWQMLATLDFMELELLAAEERMDRISLRRL